MSSNQDPTPPTTDGTPRPDGSDVWHRPMTWVYAGLVLVWMGVLIVALINRPHSSAISPRSLLKAVMFLWALSMFVMLTVPGALLALHHPWGAADRLLVERRYVHPRLQSLAAVWAGLVLSGSMGALLFAPDPFSPAPYWLPASNWFLALGVPALAVALVTLASLMAFYLVDRRR